MYDVWNLDPLYKGFDDPSYLADRKALEQVVGELDAFSQTMAGRAPADVLTEGIRLLERLSRLANKLLTYATLRQAADTAQPECGSQVGMLMAIYGGCAGADAAFRDYCAKLPNLMELVDSVEALQPYRFLFDNIAQGSRYLLPGKGEEIMARMLLSGSNAWSDLQQYLTSTVPVSYRGGQTTLSEIRNLASDPDASVRKDAYDAELACYSSIRDSVAFALNSIKLETLNDCALRGYASPLERTLKEAHMSRGTLDAMLEAMEEYLPVFRKYLRRKAEILGYQNGLPWYELFAPMGKASEKFTPEQARGYLVNLFAGFDPELSRLIADAFDHGWIDFFPRPGKSGGAFCADVEALGESRILTNFDGSFSAIITLAHELGHAFHNLCILPHLPLNRDYSMPLAETASTFNECVVMAAAIQSAGSDAQRLLLIESQLQDATQIICDIYSRYLFEAAVFDRRSEEFLNADALCALMLDAQKRSYGDALDYSQPHPYMWICKSHYYGPTFYNFPYAFGGLFARGLYARYQQEGDAFVPKYKDLLYTTTIATAEDTAKVADIDLTDKNFWRSALQTIADQVELFCRLTA